MTTQEAYGFMCLVIGAALMAGQVWVLLRTSTAATQVVAATHESQTQVVRANDSIRQAKSLSARVLQLREQGVNSESDDDLDDLQRKIDEAESQTAAAQDAADAVSKAADDWRTTLVTNLSSRIPLATAGIVLIVLGAIVNGYIDLAAGNGSTP